ncbi:A-type inclusion protein A25 [Orchesella cincta]|uniref:A-type inclusion protein A25 n=1 Tax=Orchesella cincta TaxID=48709 RepID=A0A1D2N9B1_ORCCI|nr:A-type inclusion protein A25 [Orchesella cincta]
MANVLLGIHCVVSGCGSTLRKVNQWKTKPCLTHKGKAHSTCMCPEPYQFFKFPSEVKLQKIWLDRVCSLHFAEGKPTRRNYFPSMNLSMKRNEAVKVEQMKMENDRGDNGDSCDQIADEEERGKVSLVPMELLQEQPGNDCDDEEELTVSRFHYPDEESTNSERGTSRNSAVTITRVKPITNVRTLQSSNNNSVSDIAQVATNATEARRRVTAPANRFIKFGSNQRPIVTLTPRPRPTSSILQSSTSNNSVRSIVTLNSSQSTQRYNKVTADLEDEEDELEDGDSDHESEYGYTNMDDDDGGDSSELSDIGIDIHPIRQPTSSSQSSQGKFLQKKQQLDIKPKTIPVFAVSPSTQQQQNESFEPIITSVSTVSAMKSVEKTNPNLENNNKTESNVQGQVQNKALPVMKPIINTGIPKDDQDVEVVYSAIPSMPLATYDPTKQQLQIANPIKYIQECHNRIALLLSEKQKLESNNCELETQLRKLQEENNTLRREVVYQSTKAIQRVRQTQQPQQQASKSTPFNLVPIRTLATAASRTTTEGSPKRFRYVIKRPGNIFKPNNKVLKK